MIAICYSSVTADYRTVDVWRRMFPEDEPEMSGFIDDIWEAPQAQTSTSCFTVKFGCGINRRLNRPDSTPVDLAKHRNRKSWAAQESLCDTLALAAR